MEAVKQQLFPNQEKVDQQQQQVANKHAMLSDIQQQLTEVLMRAEQAEAEVAEKQMQSNDLQEQLAAALARAKQYEADVYSLVKICHIGPQQSWHERNMQQQQLQQL